MIKIKRIYEQIQKNDGYRILVDRLWPRGIKKSEAKIDEWIKDVAPSDNLRKWFNHEPEKWMSFRKKYIRELEEKSHITETLKKKSRKKTVTLLYSARDILHNQAIVLKEYLGK